MNAAAALARHADAEMLVIFVEDREVRAFLPAPGMPQTLPGGPEWRTLLAECRERGTHSGVVAHPSSGAIVPAVACSGDGAALVFIGGDCAAADVEPICVMLPLVAALLRAEHTGAVATAEIEVARADARHAGLLARSLDTARATLERQTESLTEARSRAEAATRAKDEFLARLGHELRNPLAPITSALQLIEQSGKSSREHAIVARQVHQLRRLVDDLLDVSRIARGSVELRTERVEVAEVIARSIEATQPLIDRKHHTLVVEVADSGLVVDADPDRLAQVFSNLLTNAAKYSEDHTPIAIAAARADASVVVTVADRGLGIEPHMLETVFEQFVQQEQSMERSQGGLGLGLAIVRNLVSGHGGTVRARSAGLGAGSEFVVTLPLVEDGIPSKAPSAASPDGLGTRGTSERLLVVDDNDDAAEMLGEVLTTLGYVVRVALDGPTALEVAAEFRPHFAFLDIGLPAMDGYELARRLREAHGPSMGLVALTGYGQASDRARSLEAGFDHHLVKPVTLDQVCAVLDRLREARA